MELVRYGWLLRLVLFRSSILIGSTLYHTHQGLNSIFQIFDAIIFHSSRYGLNPNFSDFIFGFLCSLQQRPIIDPGILIKKPYGITKPLHHPMKQSIFQLDFIKPTWEPFSQPHIDLLQLTCKHPNLFFLILSHLVKLLLEFVTAIFLTKSIANLTEDQVNIC